MRTQGELELRRFRAVMWPTVTPSVFPRHRRFMVATALLAVVSVVLGLATPASAEPVPNHGSNQTLNTLRANLESAAAGYIQAEARLDKSKERQAEYEQKQKQAQAEIDAVQGSVRKYAAQAYTMGRLSPLGLMLSSRSQDELLDRMVAFDRLTQRDITALDKYTQAQTLLMVASDGIQEEIDKQNKEVEEMRVRKQVAERALAAVGGTPTRVDVDHASLPDATPAPRNPDGSFPSQSCSEDDPTTSGCLTPRTKHALLETQADGFGRYVSCYRPGDQYEHPKGRACDWASAESTFRGTATGAEKVYGDRLASYYVKNNKAFGVMYVVWYCTIWHPATGWRKYNSSGSRCGDDPAGDHTNHVHLSIY